MYSKDLNKKVCVTDVFNHRLANGLIINGYYYVADVVTCIRSGSFPNAAGLKTIGPMGYEKITDYFSSVIRFPDAEIVEFNGHLAPKPISAAREGDKLIQLILGLDDFFINPIEFGSDSDHYKLLRMGLLFSDECHAFAFGEKFLKGVYIKQ